MPKLLSKDLGLKQILRGNDMSICYKKLWKKLIDKDLKKKDLIELAGISTYTINKLNRGDNVTTDVLVKICKALDCSFDDIMEVVEDDKKLEQVD